MTGRKKYLIAFVILFAVEFCIAIFVRDRFIRPYVGDMLVTVLLCCGAKIAFPASKPALWVFLFAAGVECLQAMGLISRLGLQDTVFSIILGATFDVKDILCYGVGCLVFHISDKKKYASK